MYIAYAFIGLACSAPLAAVSWGLGYGFLRPWYMMAALILAVEGSRSVAERQGSSLVASAMGVVMMLTLGAAAAALCWWPCGYLLGAGERVFGAWFMLWMGAQAVHSRHPAEASVVPADEAVA
jgi:hypothetical protein